MQQKIINIEAEWLTKKQAAKWLGVGLKVFAMMVADGRLPDGKEFGQRTLRWYWADIFAASVVSKWPAKNAPK